MASKGKVKRVTIKDVAREAGLSRTAVSHALNGIGQISQATRAHVNEVAVRLNYRPSVRAQRLRAGRSYSIALLSSMPAAVSAGVSQLGFFTELAMGSAQTALLHGYVLLLAPPINDHGLLTQLDIDGAILLEPLPSDPITQELDERNIPYVTVGGSTAGPTNIDLHHAETAHLLFDHLLESGSRSMGLLLGESGRESQQIFYAQYLELAKQKGFPPVIAKAAEEDGETAGYEATARLLTDHPELDALCVPIDAFASGAVRAATEAGRTIGQNLLMATRYDGVRARTSSPPLTAVNLHLGEVSSAAVYLLLSLLGDSQPEQAFAAPSRPCLVVRSSTCKDLDAQGK